MDVVKRLGVRIRGVRIQKCCVRISLRIPITDQRPRPRLQADAVSDPLSVHESATRFLILTSDPCLHLTNRPRRTDIYTVSQQHN